jgi:hypothetical protein
LLSVGFFDALKKQLAGQIPNNALQEQEHHMAVYKAGFKAWRIILTILFLVPACFSLSCDGTRFLISAKKEIIATPAEMGLDYDEVWLDTSDGVRIHGWLTPGQVDMPLVIFFHGNASNISHFVDMVHYFNEMGLSTFIFDYRGFGKSRGQVIHEDNLYKDGRSAVDYLSSKGWQPSQMIFYGHSLGTAVSLQMGLETPPAAVVLESPFTSMSEVAWHIAPVGYTLSGWWATDAKFDNLAKIPYLSVPLVILQGGKDKIVPPQMAWRLFNQAREPKAFYLIPGGGHSKLFQAGGGVYKQAWLNLLKSN